MSLTLTLEETSVVRRVSIAWYRGANRSETYAIEASTDGSTFNTVVPKRTTSGASVEVVPISDVNARYVRIVGYGNTENDWNSIIEVSVDGQVPGNGGGGGSGGAKYPADVLDLTNWKLTLPLPRPNSTVAREVIQPELRTFALAPYFTLANGGGVQFQANAGGATTSGSNYPRSELREMSGSSEASWSTTNGVHTMKVKEAVTHLPVAKPDVVAAQIHDASDDVIEVRLKKGDLFVEHNGTNLGDLDTAYVLGTPYALQIEASGGHIRLSYNGVQKFDYAKKRNELLFQSGCIHTVQSIEGGCAERLRRSRHLFTLGPASLNFSRTSFVPGVDGGRAGGALWDGFGHRGSAFDRGRVPRRFHRRAGRAIFDNASRIWWTAGVLSKSKSLMARRSSASLLARRGN